MLGKVLRYLVTHAVAGGVVVLSTVVLVGVIFLVLLVWALLMNAPLGGPFALPFWLLIALVLSAVAAFGVFLPVTTLSGVVCRRVRGGYRRAMLQLPVAMLLVFLEVIPLSIWYALHHQQPAIDGVQGGALLSLILLIPLVLYWLLLQAADWMIGKCCLGWQWLRQRFIQQRIPA